MSIEHVTPTLEELMAAYPGCAQAVEWIEGTGPSIDEFWCFCRKMGFSVQEAAKRFVEVFDYGIPPESGAAYKRYWKEVIMPQLSTLDFLRYVAAKLGAM